MSNFAVIFYRPNHQPVRIMDINPHHQSARVAFASSEMDRALRAAFEAGAASRDRAWETHAQEDRKTCMEVHWSGEDRLDLIRARGHQARDLNALLSRKRQGARWGLEAPCQ